MAANTYDHAFDKFSLQNANRVPGANQVGYVFPFLLQVVKLEDTEIRVAAIRAATSSKILVDKCAGCLSASLPCQADLTSMQLASRSKVRSVAITAPPLMTRGMKVEARQR